MVYTTPFGYTLRLKQTQTVLELCETHGVQLGGKKFIIGDGVFFDGKFRAACVCIRGYAVVNGKNIGPMDVSPEDIEVRQL